MSRFKYAIDVPLSAAWVERVGKLILNFGALEFETYLWLVQLSEAPDRIPEFATERFATRVKEIMAFVESRAYSDDWKAEALKVWNDSLEHARFRNRIAHSPLTFSWTKGVEEGEPDFIGVIDLQRHDLSQTALVSKSEMDQVIDSIVSLASRLATLRMDWCAARDARQEPKTGA